jgi:hypothetical protein
MLQRLALQLRHTLALHLAPLHQPDADGAASLIRREERLFNRLCPPLDVYPLGQNFVPDRPIVLSHASWQAAYHFGHPLGRLLGEHQR